MFDKPSRVTFRDRMEEMVTALRNEIITGKRQSGDFLPSLNQLSQQYQLSKNSVQKGLDLLVAESMIEKIPRVGIRVIDPNAGGAITIRFGYYPSLVNEARLNDLLTQFHTDHPHIHVQTIPLQYDNYYDVVNHYLRSGMLDVISINYSNFNQFMNQDSEHAALFEPLEPTVDIYPYLTQSFTIDEKLYVQPFIFSPVILCYNKQHFAESKVPDPPDKWTWNDLLLQLEKLNSKDGHRLPFYFYPATDNRWPIFLLQSGSTFGRDQAGRLQHYSSQLMDSIQTCYDLIHQQNLFTVLLSESDANVEELFSQGKVSVMMTTYFGLNKLLDTNFPFDIAPLPYVHEPKTLLLTIGLTINRYSQQKEAAKLFVNYLTSYKSQLHIRQNTLSIPAMAKAAEWNGKEMIYQPSRFNTYKDIASTFALMSDLNLRMEERDQLLSCLKLFWMGLENKETTVAVLEELLGRNDN